MNCGTESHTWAVTPIFNTSEPIYIGYETIVPTELIETAFTTGSPTSAFAVSQPVVLVGVFTNLNTGTPATVSSIAGFGGTYTELVAGGILANSSRRLSLWQGTGLTPQTASITVTLSAGGQNSTRVVVVELDGIDTSDPVVDTNIQTITNPTAPPANPLTVTPNALVRAQNAFLSYSNKNNSADVTPVTGTTPADPTEFYDGNNGSSAGSQWQYLIGWTSGVFGVSWAAGTVAAGLIGVELNAAALPGGGGPDVPAGYEPTGTGWIPAGSTCLCGNRVTQEDITGLGTESWYTIAGRLNEWAVPGTEVPDPLPPLPEADE